MQVPEIKQFFDNRVTVELRNGHKFTGLLSQISYKDFTLTLEDVEDLGNSNIQDSIPHTKRLAQKVFERDNIIQILFKEKHFAEPKKYKNEDFFDHISAPTGGQKKYREKGEQDRWNKNYDHEQRDYNCRDRDHNRNDRNRNYDRQNRQDRQDRPERNYDRREDYKERPREDDRKKRLYQQKKENKEDNDRDYR